MDNDRGHHRSGTAYVAYAALYRGRWPLAAALEQAGRLASVTNAEEACARASAPGQFCGKRIASPTGRTSLIR